MHNQKAREGEKRPSLAKKKQPREEGIVVGRTSKVASKEGRSSKKDLARGNRVSKKGKPQRLAAARGSETPG